MISTLIVLLSLFGQNRTGPDGHVDPLLDRFSARFAETMLRDQLEVTKRHRTFMQSMVEMAERELSKPAILTPGVEERLRSELVWWKKSVEHAAKMQTELESLVRLWKENPDSANNWEAIIQLEKRQKEWENWKQAWDSGRIAPPPREARQQTLGKSP